jgi:hypothetical protein
MTFREFHDQVYSVIGRIFAAEESNPLTEEIQPPKNWPALQSALRAVAGALTLASDGDAAISKLREDRGASLSFLVFLEMVSDEDMVTLERRAYESLPPGAIVLPGFSFATFLLALCNNLEPPKP